MADTTTTIHQLDAPEAETLAPQLVALLQDAVASGASLGFWSPLDDARAGAYWDDVIAGVRAGTLWLLVALREGAVVGSVQLAPSPRQNAARRAEIQKLMVHRAARRQGIARELMRAVEARALSEGRTLLFLDTNTGSEAERLYHALGYLRVGVIPRYTVEADGTEHATTLFYKSLIDAPGG